MNKGVKKGVEVDKSKVVNIKLYNYAYYSVVKHFLDNVFVYITYSDP